MHIFFRIEILVALDNILIDKVVDKKYFLFAHSHVFLIIITKLPNCLNIFDTLWLKHEMCRGSKQRATDILDMHSSSCFILNFLLDSIYVQYVIAAMHRSKVSTLKCSAFSMTFDLIKNLIASALWNIGYDPKR